MKFEEIENVDALKKYLDDMSGRLDGRKYIYHYTTVQKCISIFETKMWFLSNADCMNDKVEYENGDKLRWKNVFFASFMTSGDESIGMWSMYAQPWSDGVQIAIPTEMVKHWIKSVHYIQEISCEDFRRTKGKIICDKDNRVFLSAVAYSNCDNLIGETEKLSWSTARNNKIKGASHIPDLTGYVKDSAWDYEKEIRIKAEFNNKDNFRKVAIDIPDEVLNSFIITASPLLTGSLEDRLQESIESFYSIDLKESLYTGKLILESPCNKCGYKLESRDNQRIGG